MNATRRLASCLLVLSATFGAVSCGNPPAPSSPAGTVAAAENPLAGTSWLLSSVDQAGQVFVPAQAPNETPHLRFLSDQDQVGSQILEAFGGCNMGGGIYRTDGSALQILDLAWTEKGCLGEGVMVLETAFLRSLVSASSFALSEVAGVDYLKIFFADGQMTLVLDPR